ncbi:hypothetical protein G9A89_023122 [Geosiphon pyriformis]|nr:hypothetical protein G9A89_023122 [Geosiphon pyriformis]
MISSNLFVTFFFVFAFVTSVVLASPSSMLALVNNERAKNGLSALKISSQLNNCAQDHSNYQASINQMTHSDPAGEMGDRITANGFTWSAAAENVAFGYTTENAVMDGWMNSPGHRENILGSYTHFGMGVNNNYWTQNFATPMGGSGGSSSETTSSDFTSSNPTSSGPKSKSSKPKKRPSNSSRNRNRFSFNFKK